MCYCDIKKGFITNVSQAVGVNDLSGPLVHTSPSLSQSAVQRKPQPRLAEQAEQAQRCCSTSRTTMQLKPFPWITGAL